MASSTLARCRSTIPVGAVRTLPSRWGCGRHPTTEVTVAAVVAAASSWPSAVGQRRYLAATASPKDGYKLLIVGGGTAGCAMASKFSPKLGAGKVAVVEPNVVMSFRKIFIAAVEQTLYIGNCADADLTLLVCV